MTDTHVSCEKAKVWEEIKTLFGWISDPLIEELPDKIKSALLSSPNMVEKTLASLQTHQSKSDSSVSGVSLESIRITGDIVIRQIVGGNQVTGIKISSLEVTDILPEHPHSQPSEQQMLSPKANTTLVRVFYATDRVSERRGNGLLKYSQRRSINGELEFGQCEVSIPAKHKMGKVESPSFLKFEFKPGSQETYRLEENGNIVANAVFRQRRQIR